MDAGERPEVDEQAVEFLRIAHVARRATHLKVIAEPAEVLKFIEALQTICPQVIILAFLGDQDGRGEIPPTSSNRP